MTIFLGGHSLGTKLTAHTGMLPPIQRPPNVSAFHTIIEGNRVSNLRKEIFWSLKQAINTSLPSTRKIDLLSFIKFETLLAER
jgi:hypothetical protein